MGVCDLRASFHFDPLQVVGGGYPHFEWTFAGRPPEPSPGRAFTSKISQERSETARGQRPYVMARRRQGDGVANVVAWLVRDGGLTLSL